METEKDVELVKLKDENAGVEIRGEDLDLSGPEEEVMDSDDFNMDSPKNDESIKFQTEEALGSDEEEGETIPASVFFPER